MLNWLTRRSVHSRSAGVIYGSIVASARQPAFYADWGVPDTREGRFEMIALHVALVMQRVATVQPNGAEIARQIAETFITDMDDNMREIGIGDLAVPKKIKRAAAALYDRHRDYAAAMRSDAPEKNLPPVIAAAFAGTGPQPTGPAAVDAAALTNYMLRLRGGLAVTTDEDCLAARLPLPWPPQ